MQIDSQIIIDFALAYRKHPKNAPKFGLRSWIEDDARIVVSSYSVADSFSAAYSDDANASFLD